MAASKKYSFEKSSRRLDFRLGRAVNWVKGLFTSTDEAKDNVDIFEDRMGIKSVKKLSQKDRFIVEAFLGNNLYNIYWYDKRIRKEQRKLNRYYAYTLTILLGVPIFIFVTTSSVQVGDGTGVMDQLLKEKELSTIITVVVTSLLSLHSFISSWMDQRKIVVEFSKASVELKNIYYQIEKLHYKGATKNRSALAADDEHALSEHFLAMLSDGTVLSQRIVNQETNNYYELRAQPSFDIGAIWSRSASTAKQALNLFKSSKFDPEKTERRVQTLAEKAISTKSDITTKKEQQAQLELKIRQARKAQDKISLKLDDIEHLQAANGKLTEQQQALYHTYEEEFRKLDEATDALEENYESTALEIQMLESRMGEIEEVL